MGLTVGIHDNLVLSKVEKNERGSLVVGFKQAAKINPLEALNSGSGATSFNAQEQEFLIYPPRIENVQNEIDTPDNIMRKISEIVDPLSHILHQYMTKDKVKWNITEGLDINDSNLAQKITTAPVVEKIYANIVNQFIKMASPFVNNDEKMRMILIRQSAAKHFPALRKRFLETYPFIERMSVPVSRLRYSQYEINNGYDNPNPIGGAQSVSSSEAAEANSLLS